MAKRRKSSDRPALRAKVHRPESAKMAVAARPVSPVLPQSTRKSTQLPPPAETSLKITAALLLFAVSNGLISRAHLPLLAKGWIGLLGILLPFLLLTFSVPDSPRDESQFFRPARGRSLTWKWLWILLPSAVLLRLIYLTSFQPGPGGDESMNAFLSLGLTEHWRWDFFYSCGQLPPVWTWMLAGLIGWTHQPILATWLLPAFFSILSFIAGFAAFRAVLKPDPAKWAAILWAFGFWPLFSGRFCHQGEFIPFWLMVAVLLISRLREAPRDALRLRSAGAGLWIGLGTLTFTAWLAAVPFLYLTSWELLRRRSKKKHLGWGSLTAGLLAGLTPFLVAAHHEGYGQHLLDISPLGNWTDPIRRGLVGASYVTSLLWGSLVEKGSYSSPLGGFLNPLLGGAFLVGLALLLRGIRRPRNAWLLAALPFFLAPGLLARDYIESFRIILVQPLLVAVATYGILRGSLGVQKRGRLLAVAALLTVSSVWDVGTFLSLRNPGTLSPARADSNQFGAALIRNKARSDGPGLLFTDFLTLRHNHSLSVLAYPDNAALRADLDPNHATWAAILAEPGYFGFLERDFPEGQWTSMPPRGGDPGLSLGLVPITPANRARLEGWVSAHHFFHRQNWLAENAQGFRTRYPALVSDLESGRPLMEGDPFLLSAYGEWAAQYYWDPKEARNIGFLRLAIRKGYPAPHLIRKLVDLLREQGDRKEADRIQKAYFPNEPIR